MFYNPEVFVYLMLLPVVGFIVLPALCSTTRVCIGAVKRTKVAKENEQDQVFTEEILAEA